MIVYIAGYGRSGSTLLDVIISSADSRIIGMGELGRLGEGLLRVRECPELAGDLELCKAIENDLGDNKVAIEELTVLRELERGVRGSVKQVDRYGRTWKMLLKSIRDHTGADVIVDSSKTAWDSYRRPMLLKEAAGESIYIIHLKRSYREVWTSVRNKMKRKRKGKQFYFWRFPLICIGKAVADRRAGAYRRKGYHYLQVSFEELMTDPDRVLNRIADFLKIDMSEAAQKIDKGLPLERGGAIQGNRMRRTDPIIFRKRC